MPRAPTALRFRFAARCFALLLVFASAPASVYADAAKHVLIVRSESPDLPGVRAIIDAIEAGLRASLVSPIDMHVETVETGRFSGETYERRLADLFAEKYSTTRLDLVVALSEPAVQFVMRERGLFPGAPLLFGLIDRRVIPAATLPPESSVVYVQIGPVETVKLALKARPSARKVLVIGGTSRFDRGWMQLVREDLAAFGTSVPIEYDTESSIDDLVRRAKGLSSDTVLLFVSMTRDGAGTPTRPVHALETLRAAATVPIFGLTSTYLGRGIVGGSLLDFHRHGADLGRQALHLLAGDRPAPLTTPARTAVDWHELQRHRIAASLLPPSVAIDFREPSLWERQKGTILVASLIVAIETALIVALVWNGYRRREIQQRLEIRLRFERLLSDLAVSFAGTPSSRIEETLDTALGRVASTLRIDWVWRWDSHCAEDSAWRSPLRTGDAVWFREATALPPSIQRRLHETGCETCSTLGVPLATGDEIAGALFGVFADPTAQWREQSDELRVLAAVVATVLQRKGLEDALEGSDRLKGAILDSLPAHVAVVDRAGAIIAVNDTWSAFGTSHGLWPGATVALGVNYVDVYAKAAAGDDEGARDAAILIEQACRGERTGRQVEFRTGVAEAERWFLMTAEPLRLAQGGAVVTHWEITERRRQEIALRESEDRFRRMADAMPVSVWMSDADGACIYLNKQWLEHTGRTLEEEAGEGWLESVHPDDRPAAMDSYLRAFHSRRHYRSEYRLRRHDNTYAWMYDTGTPRYGSDGTFHGYVGSCLDITQQKEAEQLLRDLSHRLMRAQDEERRRIARELHDHLSQQLALLAVDLQQLVIRPRPVHEAVPTLQDAWRRTTEIASDVHAISHRLHPSKMEALGLVGTAQGHCNDVSRQSLPVHFHHEDVPSGLPPDRALGVFRVLEEALSNVVRHSGATEARVNLTGTPTHLILRIADNGNGFVETGRTPTGLGLVSMRERLQLLEGTLNISSIPAKGTVVEARVPLPRSRDLRRPTDPATDGAAVVDSLPSRVTLPNLHS